MANLQNTKRIMISLPDHLLQEVDGIVAMENSNRSEFIRQAMKLYVGERKNVTFVKLCSVDTWKWLKST